MRKKHYFICYILFIFFLCACSDSSAAQQASCSQVFDDYKIQTKVYTKGDSVYKYQETVTVDLNKYDVLLLKDLDSYFKQNEEKYSKLKGVTYKLEKENNRIIMQTVIVDYQKSDMKELQQAGLISVNDKSNISFDKTIKLYEHDDFKCVIK